MGRDVPQSWTAELVGIALVQAFVTLDRLPSFRGPRQPGGHWPHHVTEWSDQLAQAELEESERRTRQQAANRTKICPSAEEISQLETAMGWLREMNEADSGMALVTTFWALYMARGWPANMLCARKKWAPRTFWWKRAKGLAWMAARLNGRGAAPF
jgi:hypothetical protein